jgi:hypothetical protein
VHSAKAAHEPISWAEDAVPSQIKNASQEKKISDIKNLNPFQCKVLQIPSGFSVALLADLSIS